MNIFRISVGFIFLILMGCSTSSKLGVQKVDKDKPAFAWESSTIYFLLTDRFYNGDPTNDFVHPLPSQPAPLRGFMGGDIKGITQKIESGYFTNLGVNVLWMTPLVENIEGSVDEGTGVSYGFHGYWTKDWTAIDKRIGTKEEVKEMVNAAHAKGIKVIMDIVLNHTGPVTPIDPQWPADWVRTTPKCTYKSYETTTACTLVDNLPDIKTESKKEVGLPDFLINKWKKEGRYDQEIASLDEFFKRTKHPRLPHFYIIKWITDLIEEYGIDGYRVDTAKHLEEEVWKALRKEADIAFAKNKKNNPANFPENNRFFMLGEVYNYNANAGRFFDFGDKKVDYYNYGFDALINFGFKYDAQLDFPDLFKKYDTLMSGSFKNLTTVQYLSSHDDGSPFDAARQKPLETGTKLLLSQGVAQIYYGDEVARPLTAQASGDAVLRTPLDWNKMEENNAMITLSHWQKLGKFRQMNPAVGAGKHIELSKKPNIFARTYKSGKYKNEVVFGLDLPKGKKVIPVKGVFKNGDVLWDYYSNSEHKVQNDQIETDNPFPIVLLGRKLK